MSDSASEWPVWPIDRLLSNPRNYRSHPEAQLAFLRSNLLRHGQQKPVVIQSDGVIIAGHALIEAARGLGWDAIGVHIYDGSDPDAFLLDDNGSVQLVVVARGGGEARTLHAAVLRVVGRPGVRDFADSRRDRGVGANRLSGLFEVKYVQVIPLPSGGREAGQVGHWEIMMFP